MKLHRRCFLKKTHSSACKRKSGQRLAKTMRRSGDEKKSQAGTFYLMDLMHRVELATTYSVNQSCTTPNLRLFCVQAIFQPFSLSVYLFLSASQFVATIKSLNSLTLNLEQSAWAGVDIKRGLHDTRLNPGRLENKGLKEKSSFTVLTINCPSNTNKWLKKIIYLFFG